MGEPGTQLSVWALSSASSQCLAWAHQGWAVDLSSGSAPRWGWGWGAYVRSVTVLNWNLTPVSAVLLLSSSLGHSQFLQGPWGGSLWWWTNVQVPTAASAIGSGWPAPGWCAGTVWTLSVAPERNSGVSSHVFLLSPGMQVGRAENGGLYFQEAMPWFVLGYSQEQHQRPWSRFLPPAVPHLTALPHDATWGFRRGTFLSQAAMML